MNVLEKIVEEMENESKLAHEEMRRCARGNPLQFDEVKGYARAMEYVVDTIRSHMDEVPNCGKCSRRQWYQKGIEDGKKDNDWIPVEEKLPEEDERYKGRKVIDVLVTTAKGKVTKVQRQSHNGYWWWGRIYGEPTAWQPLQEPYKKHRQ